MIQPNTTPFQYGPFRGAFVFSMMMLIAWIVLFVLTMQNCSTNCYSYSSYYTSPCVSSGSLYCCSIFSSSGPYYCGYYNSCYLDNTSCGGLSTGSWVAGSLLVVSLILLCAASMQLRKLKRLAIMNMQYAQNNGSWGNNNQNYNNNAPIYYANQPSNQQPPYNPYQNQQNQNNYAPPRYYNQN